jgi:hypothetical protein
MFRTSVAESSNLRRGSHRIPEYTVPDKVFVEYNAAAGTERGDPVKAAVKMLDFVTGHGQELPLRLPIGEDAFESLKAFHLQQLADMEKFKSWSVGTNFD